MKVQPGFSLLIMVKCEGKNYTLKKELISKREPKPKDLENSQPIHIAQNEKACSGENTKGVTSQSFGREIIDRTRELNQT